MWFAHGSRHCPRGDRCKDRERWGQDGQRGIDSMEWRGVVLLIADPNDSPTVGLDSVQLSDTSDIVFLGKADILEADVISRSYGGEILVEWPTDGCVCYVVEIMCT